MTTPPLRIQEGALSARKTPTQPPAPTKLVPIAQAAAASAKSGDKS